MMRQLQSVARYEMQQVCEETVVVGTCTRTSVSWSCRPDHRRRWTAGRLRCFAPASIRRRLSNTLTRCAFIRTVIHKRRLPHGNGDDCPRRKTPHRAPPCEELDPMYDIKLVLCRKLHLLLGKSTETAATRAALFDSNMCQIVCRPGRYP